MIYISSLLIGLINAYRGGNYSEGKWYDQLFSKYVCVIYFALLMYVATQEPYASLFFVLPYIFMFATGTGGLMTAFASSADWYRLGNPQPKEFKPFDWICYKMTNSPVRSIAEYRAWGVWYGSLVGAIFALPCLVMSNWWGLTMCLTGLVIGSLRYVGEIKYKTEPDLRWRLCELVWFGIIYSLVFGLGV